MPRQCMARLSSHLLTFPSSLGMVHLSSPFSLAGGIIDLAALMLIIKCCHILAQCVISGTGRTAGEARSEPANPSLFTRTECSDGPFKPLFYGPKAVKLSMPRKLYHWQAVLLACMACTVSMPRLRPQRLTPATTASPLRTFPQRNVCIHRLSMRDCQFGGK